MSIGLIVLLLVLGFIVIGGIGYFVTIYTGLIRIRRNIDRNWSNIDVLLKRRYDELPKLVKVCEAYMKYEKGTLEKITSLRSQYLSSHSVGETSKLEGEMTKALRGLSIVVERYPDLKANQEFTHLQERISGLEGEIADRRELYNSSVNIYNIRIHQIPDLVVAGLLKYMDRELFTVPEEERKDVDLKFTFPG